MGMVLLYPAEAPRVRKHRTLGASVGRSPPATGGIHSVGGGPLGGAGDGFASDAEAPMETAARWAAGDSPAQHAEAPRCRAGSQGSKARGERKEWQQGLRHGTGKQAGDVPARADATHPPGPTYLAALMCTHSGPGDVPAAADAPWLSGGRRIARGHKGSAGHEGRGPVPGGLPRPTGQMGWGDLWDTGRRLTGVLAVAWPGVGPAHPLGKRYT